MGFPFKTEPYAHQRTAFNEHADTAAWGHLWEQGVGKTKVGIDQAAYQYQWGRIKRLFVLAPNGVHRNWALDEIPPHMPDFCNAKTFIWDSSQASGKRWLQSAADMLKYDAGLAVLTMSYNGFCTKLGRRFAQRWLEEPCMMILDESHHCKTPGISRTRAVVAIGRRATTRRIFTGTYCDEGPFDVFSQIRFLDDEFWLKTSPQFPTFADFKSYFGIWKTGHARGRKFPMLDKGRGSYRHLPELREMLKGISDRLTLKEVMPWLPDHRFTTKSFELPAAWRRAYNELEEFYETTLDTGDTVTADLGIVRSLRLHQICCGYVATDDGADGALVDLSDDNPRLELLESIADDLGHQAIIWATWTRDVDKLMDVLGKRAVRFDGKVKDADRHLAKQKIKAGDAQFLVGNPAACGEGHTILVPTMMYYSLGYKARLRNQSLARNRRPGADEVVGEGGSLEVIDFMASGTKDVDVVDALNFKKKVAAIITGDDER